KKKAHTTEAPADLKNPFEGFGVPNAAKIEPRPPPMLVQKPGDTSAANLGPSFFRHGAFMQRKFNGVRVVCYLDPEGNVVMYSRARGLYPGHDQIRAELKQLLQHAPAVKPNLYAEPPSLAAVSKTAASKTAASKSAASKSAASKTATSTVSK